MLILDTHRQPAAASGDFIRVGKLNRISIFRKTRKFTTPDNQHAVVVAWPKLGLWWPARPS